jgi:type VI secretion system secreted protein Hcp
MLPPCHADHAAPQVVSMSGGEQMAVNAFLRFEGVEGESAQKGHERWIEVQGWDWEIEAEATVTGSGASVGKPRPSALTWSHSFDTASIALLGKIATGRVTPKAELHAVRASADGRSSEPYLKAVLEGVRVTRVATTGAEDGSVQQLVSIVFTKITMDYRRQDPSGKLGTPTTFSWDIPSGVASPSG